MGAEIALGLLLVGTLQLQQAVNPLPVAYAKEVIQETIETPAIPVQEPKKLRLQDLPWDLQKAAICESGGMQFRPNGKIVKNPITPDYGLF
jgi:hypothetical protein